MSVADGAPSDILLQRFPGTPEIPVVFNARELLPDASESQAA